MKRVWFRGALFGALVLGLTAGLVPLVDAQDAEERPRQVRVSPYAETLQRIGIYDVKVTYHRPGVKGREIWNTNIVPYGGDPMPWRAGANENTVFEFESDVLIEGEELAAGKYGFHIIPTEAEWTLIFSNDSSGWGSFRYKEENDALRVQVTPVDAAHEEWLRYGFEDLTADSATAYLHWEEKKIPFSIALDAE